MLLNIEKIKALIKLVLKSKAIKKIKNIVQIIKPKNSKKAA